MNGLMFEKLYLGAYIFVYDFVWLHWLGLDKLKIKMFLIYWSISNISWSSHDDLCALSAFKFLYSFNKLYTFFI